MLSHEFVEDVSKDDGFVAWAANAATFGKSDSVLSNAELKFSLNRAKAKFEAGEYRGILDGKCPKCGHVQSWYQEPKMMTVGNLILSVILALCLWAIPALIVFLILFLAFGEDSLDYLMIGLSLCMAVVVILRIKSGVRELKENKKTFKPSISKPIVFWNDGSDTTSPAASPASPAHATAKPASGNKNSLPTCWVFACYDSERVQGLSMFQADFYIEANIIKRVREQLHIPNVVSVKYVAPNAWSAPDITATQDSFDCKMDEIDSKVNAYLVSQTGCDADKPKNALKTTMPYPNAGLLLVIVSMEA